MRLTAVLIQKGHRITGYPQKTSLGVLKPTELVQTYRINHSTPVHQHQGPQNPNNLATPSTKHKKKATPPQIHNHINRPKMINVSFQIVDDRAQYSPLGKHLTISLQNISQTIKKSSLQTSLKKYPHIFPSK